jgi:predicted component of type VI protein secretion system
MTLLDALSGGGESGRSRQAVTEHLARLLGSVQAYGFVRADYGVAAEALLGGKLPTTEERRPIERLREEILSNVQRFEPGLCNVEVTVVFRDPQGSVFFQLEGDLAGEGLRARWALRFSTWSRRLLVEPIL